MDDDYRRPSLDGVHMTMRYNDADETLLFRSTGTDAGKLIGEPCCSNKNNCIPPLRCNYNVTLSDLVGTLAEWNGAHVVAWRATDSKWFLQLRTGAFPAYLRLWWVAAGGLWDAGWYCQVVENVSGGGQPSCTWYLNAGECAPAGAYAYFFDTKDEQEDSTAVVS